MFNKSPFRVSKRGDLRLAVPIFKLALDGFELNSRTIIFNYVVIIIVRFCRARFNNGK